jgi:hypothetical protein
MINGIFIFGGLLAVLLFWIFDNITEEELTWQINKRSNLFLVALKSLKLCKNSCFYLEKIVEIGDHVECNAGLKSAIVKEIGNKYQNKLCVNWRIVESGSLMTRSELIASNSKLSGKEVKTVWRGFG